MCAIIVLLRQVLHQHQQAAADLQQRRENMLRRSMLGVWHVQAAKLHHRRVIVAYFRARHLRLEGVEVFHAWKGWAAERGRMRRATVAYWNRLMTKVNQACQLVLLVHGSKGGRAG